MIAVLAAGALWLVLRSQQSDDATRTPEISAPAAAEPAAPAKTAPALPAPSPVATPAAAPIGEAPAAANSDQGAAGSAGAEGVKVVVIKVRPASATFYYKGKKVGTSPLRVELRPGEKRAFEVGHPNYNTRKVVARRSGVTSCVSTCQRSSSSTSSGRSIA
jgi:nucleoid-associated protein YgaU